MEVKLPQQPDNSSLYSTVVSICLPMDSEQIGGLITQPLRLEQWQVQKGGNVM